MAVVQTQYSDSEYPQKYWESIAGEAIKNIGYSYYITVKSLRLNKYYNCMIRFNSLKNTDIRFEELYTYKQSYELEIEIITGFFVKGFKIEIIDSHSEYDDHGVLWDSAWVFTQESYTELREKYRDDDYQIIWKMEGDLRREFQNIIDQYSLNLAGPILRFKYNKKYHREAFLYFAEAVARLIALPL